MSDQVTTTTALVEKSSQTPLTAALVELKIQHTLAESAHRSGFFRKFPNKDAALMVIQMGKELGLPPVSALTSLHCIDGKPSPSANMLWGLVLKHPDWEDSYPSEYTDQKVTITWVKKGKVKGTTTWTMQDAQRAGLANKDNWKKYPRNMLFARAIADGFRLYAAHLLNGQLVYTPDELGVRVDADGNPLTDQDGDVIMDADFTVSPTTGASSQRERLLKLLAEHQVDEGFVVQTMGVLKGQLQDPSEAIVNRIEVNLNKRKEAVTVTA